MAELVSSTHRLHRFTGKERDAESGLDYFGARYYSSSMGRFMSPDPLNPVRTSRKVLRQILEDSQEWNKYIYAPSNPVASAPTAICKAAALYNALSSLKTATDAANKDLAKTYGTGAALLGPTTAMKYGMGASFSLMGMAQSYLAGAFVKTYFVTVPSWLSAASAAGKQYDNDVKACGGG